MLKQFKHKRFSETAIMLSPVIGYWHAPEQGGIVPCGNASDNINCRPCCACT